MTQPQSIGPLTLQLLDWLAARPRSHAEVIDTWRSTCPRLSIWEDAILDGLARYDGTTRTVALTPLGKAVLSAASPPPPGPMPCRADRRQALGPQGKRV